MNIHYKLRAVAVCCVLMFTFGIYAQDRVAAQQVIEDLCSEEMAGRGYISSGEKKAATYIATKFESIGLSKFNGSYFQEFTLPVNTITEVDLALDGQSLKPGYDYLVAPNSGSVNINSSLFYVSERLLHTPRVGKKVKKAIKKGYMPVISSYDPKDKDLAENVANIKECNPNKTLIYLKQGLTWSVGREQKQAGEVWLLDSVFDRFTKDVSLNISANYVPQYTTQNVIGYVPGTESPDSVVIFCGHYDHLGKMGDATFYGANDNASGISILLDMANYFANNPQKYSVMFIAFGAEEAGLVGSYHYVSSPLVPLSKTKFVFNMDLMGSGEDGATIVNGSVFKDQFDQLKAINTEHNYLPRIKSRGKAANSDHYFFTEAGVPSFFIYLMGEYKHYHVPADNSKNLELTEYYDKSFLLIRDFIILLNK